MHTGAAGTEDTTAEDHDPAGPGGDGTRRATASTDAEARGRRRSGRPVVPAWTLRAMAVSAAVLTLAAVAWLTSWVLLRLPLVTFTLAVALLVAALMAPVSGALRRAGLPAAPSALLAVLSLVAVIGGIGFLFGFRVASAMQDLSRPLAAGVDRIRVWAIEGPLHLDPQQVSDIRNQIVNWIYEAAPAPPPAPAWPSPCSARSSSSPSWCSSSSRTATPCGPGCWSGFPRGGTTRSTGPAARPGTRSPTT